jgi:hypothetical protein
MASIYTKRLTKELKGLTDGSVSLNIILIKFHFNIDLNKNPPEGVVIEEAENLKKFVKLNSITYIKDSFNFLIGGECV